MKHFLLLFILTTITQTLISGHADYTQYDQQATIWVQNYVFDGKLLISDAELHYIANLLYFSYLRSQITVQAQQALQNTYDFISQGTENVLQARLDPSKPRPHTIEHNKKQVTLEQFWHLHDEHARIGATYSHAVNTVVHGNVLGKNIVQGVDELRTSARSVVAHALVDAQRHLHKLTELCYKTAKKSVQKAQKMMPLVNMVWEALPQIALGSFIKADAASTQVRTASWKTLQALLATDCHIWETVESARAAYYRAHYNALQNALSNTEIPLSYLFDEHGIMLLDQDQEALPESILQS